MFVDVDLNVISGFSERNIYLLQSQCLNIRLCECISFCSGGFLSDLDVALPIQLLNKIMIDGFEIINT